MVNPTHPGESIRNCIDESDWTVTECAARLGVSRNNLSRLLNGRIGISARVALGLGACRELAPSKQESTTYEPSLVCKLLILGCRLLIPDRLLEAVGWSNAEFWMRLQASYDLAQERRKQAAA